ncbi:hypothetical protein LIER_38573 [Lithospermum erythrorhizon]|uniref:Mitochondrial protein n=1 Tax=Lithospermum erythrorhizon TaxID=34254 RepID=A0AAV3Q2R3_LITER
MSSCKPSATLIDTKSKLSGSFASPCEDPSLFRSLVGALQYLTFTRPDISYAVRQISVFMHAPMTNHMLALKRLVRYLHGWLPRYEEVQRQNIVVLRMFTIYLSENPIQHQRTKHIELDIHFVREKVVCGHVRILHVPSRYQIADIFTKSLPLILFTDFRDSLSVRFPPAPTTRVY